MWFTLSDNVLCAKALHRDNGCAFVVRKSKVKVKNFNFYESQIRHQQSCRNLRRTKENIHWISHSQIPKYLILKW